MRASASSLGLGCASVERAGDAQGQRERGFGFEREIGEHRLHRRLFDQKSAERLALAAMVERLRRRHAHAGRGADHAVEARRRHHFEDRRDAAPLRADPPAERAAPFGLARGVGDIAHLALEPHDLNRVLDAVGAPARGEKTGQAAGRLSERQKGVAHRRRDEELVADEFVSLTHRVAADRKGARRVGAHIRAALFFGHRHADRQSGLLARGHVARIVGAGVDFRQPLACQRRLLGDAGRGGESHGDRAAVARLDLRLHVIARGARDMGAGARIGPRRRMQPEFDRAAHQLVIGGMVANEVDPVAVAVVSVELGQVAIGERAQFQRLGRSEPGAEARQFVLRPAGALARRSVLQRRVAGEEIEIDELGRLVEDLVGRRAAGIETGARCVLAGRVWLRHRGLPGDGAARRAALAGTIRQSRPADRTAGAARNRPGGASLCAISPASPLGSPSSRISAPAPWRRLR